MGRILNNPKQVLIGIAALVLGVAVYSFGRPTWQFTLLPDLPQLYWWSTDAIGGFANSLPSFLHVFGFSMLCAGIIGATNNSYIVICSLWALINVSFELLQSDYLLAVIQHDFLNGLLSVFISNWLQNYSLNTVFDDRDVLAILLGAISAYWVLKQTQQREAQNERIKA